MVRYFCLIPFTLEKDHWNTTGTPLLEKDH